VAIAAFKRVLVSEDVITEQEAELPIHVEQPVPAVGD
jgi:hypothetical protein